MVLPAWIGRTIWRTSQFAGVPIVARSRNQAVEQADAADEGRLEPSGSTMVGHSAAGWHRERGQGRAPLAADPQCSADILEMREVA